MLSLQTFVGDNTITYNQPLFNSRPRTDMLIYRNVFSENNLYTSLQIRLVNKGLSAVCEII